MARKDKKFKTYGEAIVDSDVIFYLTECVKHQGRTRGIRAGDFDDIAQDIVLVVLTRSGEKPLASSNNWQGLISTIVTNHLNSLGQKGRAKAGNGFSEVLESDLSAIERDQYDRARVKEDGDGTLDLPSRGATLTEHFKHLFGAVLRNCNPVELGLPRLIDNAVAYGSKQMTPERSKKRLEALRIIRCEYPVPSNRRIADRVGLSDKAIAGLKQQWKQIRDDFDKKVAQQWNELDDVQRLEWLRGVIAGYVTSVLAELRVQQRDDDVKRWREMCKR